MAQYDGEVVFNTKMDTDGVEKGAEDASAKILGMKNKVAQIEREIERLTSELKKLANTEVKSDQVKGLESEIAKLEAKLGTLDGKADTIFNDTRSDLESLGFSAEQVDGALDGMLQNNGEWQKLQNEITETDSKLQSYKAQLEAVKKAEGSTSGADTAEYAKKAEKLQQLKEKQQVYTQKLNEAEKAENKQKKTTSKNAKAMKSFGSTLKKVGKSLASAFKNSALSMIKKIGSGIKSIGSHSKKSAGQVGALSKLFNMIKQALGGILIYQGISKIFDATKESIQDLAQVDDETNASLSTLMSSLTQLKNSFASAFAPILNTVAPILNKLISLLTTVTDKVAQFFAALTGSSTYTKASTVQQDYAESVADTTAATEENTEANEENQKSLAGFDELNVLSSSDSDSGSSTDSGTSSTDLTPSDMFETATVASQISDFAQTIKDLFAAEDFSGIGETLASAFNGILNGIDWTGIQAKLNGWAKNIAELLNGLVSGVDWALLGSTFSNGLNTLFGFINTFATTFDWAGLGAAIGTFLNGALEDIDMGLIAETLSSLVLGMFSAIIGFIDTVDWQEVGDNIVTFISNIDWKGIGEAAKKLLKSFANALKKIDFSAIGDAFSEGLSDIDWDGIWDGVTDVVTGLIDAIAGLFGFKNINKSKLNSAMKSLKEPLEKLLDGFGTLMDSFLTPIVNDVLPAIVKVVGSIASPLKKLMKTLSPIVSMILEKLSPVLEKIGSVAGNIFTVVAEIIDALSPVLEPLLDILTAIADVSLNVLGAIISIVENFFGLTTSKAAEEFAEEIDGIKSSLEETTSAIEENLSSTLETLDNMYADNTLIDTYQEKLNELLEKAELTPSEQSQLQTIVTYFENNVDGFDTTWDQYVTKSDDGTYHLKAGLCEVQEAINSTIDEYQRLANASALSELSAENSKERITASQDYAEAKSAYDEKQEELEEAKEKLNKWLNKKGMTLSYFKNQIAWDSSLRSDALYKEGFELYDAVKNEQAALDEASDSVNETIAAMNELTMTGDDLSDVQNVLNGDYSDAAAVLMAYNAGLISTEDVQNSQWKSLNNLEKAAKETGKNTVIGLVDGTNAYKDALVENSNGLANLVLSEYDSVMDIHSPSKEMYNRGVWTVEGLVNGLSDNMPTVKSVFSQIWDGIKSVFGGVADWFKDKFSKAWQAVKDVFSTGGKVFDGIKSGIVTAFKTVVNAIISGINKVVAIPFNTINGFLDTLRSIDILGVQPFNWIGSIDVPQIPRLATGTVVPANYGEFLAVLGDNKRETEVVSPLSTMKQALSEALAEFSGSFGTSDDQEINIYMDGDKVFNVVVKHNDSYKKRHGKSRLA